jgi:non-ribosomal peptide synthetase component E (peptide arylation enzyme)
VLEGVVPFPPEFARRYREKGYWRDLSLAEEFAPAFKRYAERIALIDRDARVTYGEVDDVSDRLALNLLEAGLAPLDRVVVQLPNVIEFVYLYFALQKIGCIPIAALVTHRFLEVSQFAKLSGAAACVTLSRRSGLPRAEETAGGPARAQDRSDGPRDFPALGRHDRRAQADTAHAQRLRLQFQDRGESLRGYG